MKQALAPAAAVLLLLAGCRSFHKLSNQNVAPEYDYRETVLHPDFVLYHPDDSTTILYARVLRDEVFRPADSAGNPSGPHLRLAWAAYASYDAKAVIDSGSAVFTHPSVTGDAYLLTVSFTLPLPAFVVEATLTDLARRKPFVKYVEADRRSPQAGQRFLLLAEDHAPLFRHTVAGDEPFRVYGNGLRDRPATVRCYFRDFPVAAPPFSSRFPVQFDYRADSVFTLTLTTDSLIRLPRDGIYHIQYDTSVKAGLTVFRTTPDFPRLTDARGLIESLRYITTNEEYGRLNEAVDAKAAVDAFWVELAGNRERARTLIRKYYTRIQEANRLFTSYLDGWKTDRGMIFTVMGNPTSVFRTSETEEWTYGNYNDISAVTFSFDKIYNPFSDNDYILRRSAYYETIWYRMVERWRQGAAVND